MAIRKPETPIRHTDIMELKPVGVCQAKRIFMQIAHANNIPPFGTRTFADYLAWEKKKAQDRADKRDERRTKRLEESLETT